MIIQLYLRFFYMIIKRSDRLILSPAQVNKSVEQAIQIAIHTMYMYSVVFFPEDLILNRYFANISNTLLYVITFTLTLIELNS